MKHLWPGGIGWDQPGSCIINRNLGGFCSHSYPWQRARMAFLWEVLWHLLERQTAAFLGSPRHEASPLYHWRYLRWRLPVAKGRSDFTEKQMPETAPCIVSVTDINVHFWLHVEILGQPEYWGFLSYSQGYYWWKTRTWVLSWNLAMKHARIHEEERFLHLLS